MTLISAGSRKFLATLVSAVAAIMILGVAAWMLTGSKDGGPQADGDVRIISPAPASAESSVELPTPPAQGARPDDTPAAPDIAVYITGEVVKPGVYTVPEGQRLDDVLNLAGGATEEADLNRVNLAAYVADAVHYRIPAKGASEDGAVGAVPDAYGSGASEVPSAAACVVPIDINVATAECLETLPGIGEVRAQSIVDHREQVGPFVTTDGITAVSGIGDGIYGRVAEMITVNSR